MVTRAGGGAFPAPRFPRHDRCMELQREHPVRPDLSFRRQFTSTKGRSYIRCSVPSPTHEPTDEPSPHAETRYVRRPRGVPDREQPLPGRGRDGAIRVSARPGLPRPGSTGFPRGLGVLRRRSAPEGEGPGRVARPAPSVLHGEHASRPRAGARARRGQPADSGGGPRLHIFYRRGGLHPAVGGPSIHLRASSRHGVRSARRARSSSRLTPRS